MKAVLGFWRRHFWCWTGLSSLRLSVVLLAGLSSPALASNASPPPNILWITCEDMSPNMGCYGDAFAPTPHLDKFAQAAVRYTRAFATAPVCSPARSCLITGLYASSLNTRNEPDIIKTSWDVCSAQAHWRQRKPGQPFFSVFNLMDTHQSRTRSAIWPGRLTTKEC